MDPYGEGELGTITLKALWSHASKGHDHCERFSEYAIDDKNYQGYALAKSMKSLHLAIAAAIDEKEAGELLDPTVFATIKAEGEALLPHVITLSGGQMRKETPLLNTFKAAAIEPAIARKAAKEVYAWLQKSKSPLRGVLKFLANGGLFYTGIANEKMTRAFLANASVSEDNFVDLGKHRLCQTPAVDTGNFDWAAINKTKTMSHDVSIGGLHA